MSLTYATMEKKLGEVDRARAIFVHGSQVRAQSRGSRPQMTCVCVCVCVCVCDSGNW